MSNFALNLREYFIGRFRKLAGISALTLTLFGCARDQRFSSADYRHQYSKPLLSPGTQFASLPPAVQNTIRAEAGAANIQDIEKDTSLGRVIYQVRFQNRRLLQPLWIAADGSLLDVDRAVAIGAPKDETLALTGRAISGTTINDLPPAAVKAIQKYAPDTQVDSVIRQVSGNQVVYIVTFKNQTHPPVQVAADGSITPTPAR